MTRIDKRPKQEFGGWTVVLKAQDNDGATSQLYSISSNTQPLRSITQAVEEVNIMCKKAANHGWTNKTELREARK